MDKYIELFKTLDFSGGGSHKDDLRKALKNRFAQCSHRELTDDDLNHVSAALGNTESIIDKKRND